MGKLFDHYLFGIFRRAHFLCHDRLDWIREKYGELWSEQHTCNLHYNNTSKFRTQCTRFYLKFLRLFKTAPSNCSFTKYGMLRTTNWKGFETQVQELFPAKHHKKVSKLPEHRTFENKHKIRFIQVLDRFICLMSKRVNEWKTKENQAKRSPPFCPKSLKTSWDEIWKKRPRFPIYWRL